MRDAFLFRGLQRLNILVNVLSVGGFFSPREKTSQMNTQVPHVLTLDNVRSVSACALCLTQWPSVVKVGELQLPIK